MLNQWTTRGSGDGGEMGGGIFRQFTHAGAGNRREQLVAQRLIRKERRRGSAALPKMTAPRSRAIQSYMNNVEWQYPDLAAPFVDTITDQNQREQHHSKTSRATGCARTRPERPNG